MTMNDQTISVAPYSSIFPGLQSRAKAKIPSFFGDVIFPASGVNR